MTIAGNNPQILPIVWGSRSISFVVWVVYVFPGLGIIVNDYLVCAGSKRS